MREASSALAKLAGAALIVMTSAMSWSAPGLCLEQGRAWTPLDVMRVNGFRRLYPSRLDLGPDGLPMVYATAVGGVPSNEHVLSWQDSLWSVQGNLGYATEFLHPVVTTGERGWLVWQTIDQIKLSEPPYLGTHLVAGRFRDGAYLSLDTLGWVAATNWIYSGAATARQEWILKSDYVGVNVWAIRGWTKVPDRGWEEFRLPGTGQQGVALAPVNDTTALAAWENNFGPLRWGWLRGGEWEDGGTVPGSTSGFVLGPHFSRSPDGRLWLAWSTDADFAQIASFENGTWTYPETLRCAKLVPGTYLSKELRPSRDGWDKPVVAWVEHDSRRGFQGTVCISIPTETGYSAGENLPGSDDAIYAEAVRDSLGDVWIVWRTWDDGMFWQHSHTDAVVKQVSIQGRGNRLALVWALDQGAPGSWWTVLRSIGGASFEPVGRIRAGQEPELTWAIGPRPNQIGRSLMEESGRGHDRQMATPSRFKLRRDCLDAKYRWESEAIEVPDRGIGQVQPNPGRPRLRALHQSGKPLVDLELNGFVFGRARLALFDLQGRLVVARDIELAPDGASRFGLDTLTDLLPAGIYFAVARDDRFSWSNAERVVVLK